MLSFDIRHFDVLDSTNKLARLWIQEGVAEGVVIVADRQTAGKGRQGRSWSSVPGGLMFSIILRPLCPLYYVPRLGFIACVAAARAAESFGLPHAWLKWPNDLVMMGDGRRGMEDGKCDGGRGTADGRSLLDPSSVRRPPSVNEPSTQPFYTKWGGILVETGGDSDHCHWAVIGVGLNVGSLAPPDVQAHTHTCNDPTTHPPIHPSTHPPIHPAPYASLSDTLGVPVQPREVLDRFLEQFALWYGCGLHDSWDAVLEEWRRRDFLLGHPVSALSPGGQLHGVARGIDDDGALLLESAAGIERVEAGDVHLTRET